MSFYFERHAKRGDMKNLLSEKADIPDEVKAYVFAAIDEISRRKDADESDLVYVKASGHYERAESMSEYNVQSTTASVEVKRIKVEKPA